MTAEARWIDAGALLAHDGALLRQVHGALVRRGTPPPAAATYLVSWYGGAVARQVGRQLARHGEAPVVDGAGLSWHVGPEGWPDDVEIVGAPSTDVDEVVGALAIALTPLVRACHGLARVGIAGLWNEVGDALGGALAWQVGQPVGPEEVERLTEAVASAAAPWRAQPDLRFVESDALGPVLVVQKGGCCLAYTVDADAPEPPWCASCSLRERGDCDRRQVAWHEAQAEAAVGIGGAAAG